MNVSADPGRLATRPDRFALIPGILALILAGSAFLALLFMANVPSGYGPDEPSHYGYIRFLAGERRLPVLGSDTDPDGPSYESHQPPLYYLLALPFAAAGRAVAGEAGGWTGARLFSLLCGLGTVALVYHLARRLFPEEPAIAAGAAAFAGWLPSQAFLFSVTSNDPLTELGFTAALCLAARHCLSLSPLHPDVRPGGVRRAGVPFWIGVAAGATVLVKASALILIAVLPALLLFAPREGSEVKGARWRDIAWFFAGAAVCLPWLARNQLLYGDPLGWAAFQDYFQNVMRSPTPETMMRGTAITIDGYWIDTVLRWAWMDSLGMWLFQPPGAALPRKVSFAGTMPWAYPAWGLLWAAAVVGLIRFAFGEGRRLPAGWRCLAAAGLGALVLLFIAYLRLNAVFFWAHSRYLFPAVGVLALAWSAGLAHLVPARSRGIVLGAASGLLFFLAAFAAFSLLGGFFLGVTN